MGYRRRKKSKRHVGIISVIISAAVLTILIAAFIRTGGHLQLSEFISTLSDRPASVRKIENTYIDPDTIPAYNGRAYTEINGNVPELERSDGKERFEIYGYLDKRGRCTAVYANVSQDTMPDKERESIGSVKPTGWHLVKYEGIDGNYLYNRCHLIAYQLTGENANEKNLITGTRYMNTEGMLPFEIKVADYIKKTGHHVLYKVVPVFRGNNLLAEGIWMQALSVEDDEISFNVFCYNVQPGIGIDYKNGDSWRK